MFYFENSVIREQIGSGSFGIVSKVTNGDDESVYFAMKQVDKKRLMKKRVGFKGNAFDLIKVEIAVWKKVTHPNCLALIEVIDDPGNMSFVE